MNVLPALLLLAAFAPNQRSCGVRAQVPDAAPQRAPAMGKLIARIVDEQGAPRPNFRLHHFSCNDAMSATGTSASSGRDSWIQSDASGWIQLELTASEVADGPRYVQLSDLGWDSPTGEQEAEFYLPDEFHGGVLELGDLVIAPRGTARRFVKFDDAQLREEFERLLRLKTHREDMYEDMVFECVRRGGTRWAEYFEALVESRRPKSEADNFPIGPGPTSLTLLTAARRLRGDPDPLSIGLEPGTSVDFGVAEHPVIQVCWRNADRFEPITIQPPELTDSSYGPVRIEARD